MIAEKEELERIRSFIDLEIEGKMSFRYYPAASCREAWEQVNMNPYFFGMIYVGSNIIDAKERRDLSRDSDSRYIRYVYSLNPRILIFFCTKRTYLPVNFFSVPCICVIRAPIRREDIQIMLQRAEAVEGMRCGKLSARLPVYDLKETQLIPAGAILYARKVRKGINLYTECGEFLNRQKLDDFEKGAGKLFLRCHSSLIANVCHIRRFSGKELLMDDGKILQVSRSYYKKVSGYFEEYNIFVSEDIK